MPDINEEPELYNLVQTYQSHHHSKSCRKYKNKKFRYSFGKFFTDRTIIAEPLPEQMSEEDRKEIMNKKKIILDKVKDYIDSYLDPKVKNFHHPDQQNYEQPKTSDEILTDLNIPKEDYENALSISNDSGFQIHFKRTPKSYFTNNYFTEGLMAREANIDIQPVLDYYKAVSYMCAYISKSEDESSEAMKKAASAAMESGETLFKQMKSIATAYRTHREMSVQEAVAIVMPEIYG